MIQVSIPVPVLAALKHLLKNNHSAEIVGGAVRDVLLQRQQILDWDITTDATPEQIQDLFPQAFYDNNYGTVMIAPKHLSEQFNFDWPEDHPLDVLDITTYRSETGYTNQRHPDQVEWGESLEEDTQRRDFTINALALDIQPAELPDLNSIQEAQIELKATVIDYHQGLQDLNQRLIRTVGQPEARFKEDALRMLRAVRFATQLECQIEPQTQAAIDKLASNLKVISGERIKLELWKILSSHSPADGIDLLDKTGLLKYILPELLQGKGVAQGGRHQYDVYTHNLESLRHCPSPDPLIRLATLLHDIGKPKTAVKQGPRGVTFYGHEVVGAHMSKRIAARLKLSRKETNLLFRLIRWHMFTYDPDMTNSAIRRFIRRVGVENINHMMNLRIGDRKGGGSKATSWRLRELQERIGENLYEPMSVRDLKVNGQDIMQHYQIKPSKAVGQVLNYLFYLVMEDQLDNDREQLLEYLNQHQLDELLSLAADATNATEE